MLKFHQFLACPAHLKASSYGTATCYRHRVNITLLPVSPERKLWSGSSGRQTISNAPEKTNTSARWSPEKSN